MTESMKHMMQYLKCPKSQLSARLAKNLKVLKHTADHCEEAALKRACREVVWFCEAVRGHRSYCNTSGKRQLAVLDKGARLLHNGGLMII